jgi:hypothetical protein
MSVLAPSKEANEAAGKKHKTTVDWTLLMVRLVCRSLGKRAWVLIGDGAYACLELARECLTHQVTFISRLRLDAQLYEFPAAQVLTKRGRKRIKGDRIRLKDYATDDKQAWQHCEVNG